MKRLTYLLLLTLTVCGMSCIKNDIPYPIEVLNIEGVSGDGFTVASIDAEKRIVTLTLDERTDIRNVEITQVKLTDQATPSRELTGIFDLRTPIYVTLSLYQDYEWTIRAEQHIERRFAVGGQVGSTVFDTENRTATAYVTKTADRSKVTVTELKLGAQGVTDYSPTLAQLSGTSFESVRFVDVTSHGITERWMLYVLPTDKTVELTGADAWSRVIWLYGEGIEGQPMGFRFRKQTGANQWTEWTEAKDVTTVNIRGGSFDACIPADPSSTYQVLAYCGDDTMQGSENLLTQGEPQLENSGFEQWCTIKDIVYPFSDDQHKYWGTGNKGAAIASETLTDKDAPRPGSTGQYSAALRSKFANIAGIGKFAAGNLFLGEYLRTEGTNGVITFGRSFTLRPRFLRIWYKYNQGIIDKVKGKPVGTEIQIGDPDNGHIYIALGTWTPDKYGWDAGPKGDLKDRQLVGTADSPICIDTRNVATFFDPNGPDVVAFGQEIITRTVGEWTEKTIEIVYKNNDTHTVPTNVMIVCSASRYGDYFTGSTKSELWVDDFELIY